MSGRALILALLPLFALAMRLLSEPTANLSYVVLAFFALMGRAQAVEALAWSWFFTVINPGIAPEATAAGIGRYLVIAGSAFSVALRAQASHPASGMAIERSMLQTGLLGCLLVIHSILFSVVPAVSILKIGAWMTVLLTLISAWGGLTPIEHLRLKERLRKGLCLIVVLSVPLVFVPDAGYLKNGSGFQGLLFHPQAFGPTAAIFGGLTLGRFAEGRRPSWGDAGLLGCSVVLIMMSEARSAALGFFGGAALALVLAPRMAGQSLFVMAPGLRSARAFLLCGLAVAGLAVSWSVVSERVVSFALKRSDSFTLGDAATASRGELVGRMLANIEGSPLQGIGFGIASEPEYMEIEREPLFGLPISAQVEKGVLPLAILEEVGLALGGVVFLWMFGMARRAALGGFSTLLLVLIIYLLNLGESALLSAGGMGLLLTLLLVSSAIRPKAL